jgi:DNA-binding GntR family transcriptional regulator
MRAAIAMLEEEGYVRRRHGSGTYVTHRPALPNDLGRNFGVSSLIASTGLEPGTVEEELGEVPAPPAVAEALGVAEGEPVSSLRRVRTASGRRVVDVTDWCRVEHLPPADLPHVGSVYAALAERGLAVEHGVAHLAPWNADGDVAQRLGVPSGTLLLTIEQVDRTADGVAVLFSREHHLADAFTFTLLRRGPGDAVEEEH